MGVNWAWATAITFAAALSAMPARGATPASCVKVDAAAMFPKTDTAEYDFTGDDGAKLVATFDEIVGHPSTAVSMHVLYLPDFADFFLFTLDGAGCVVYRALGLKWAEVEKIFDRAGVQPPFGSTFYQVPSVKA